MKAQNLTISVPYKGCDKDCPYCISKMTGYIESDEDQFRANMFKARTVAKAAQVSSILITGKGEPFLNIEACNLIGENFVEFPIEIQTNGIKLMQQWDENKTILGSKYLDVIAFSIDDIDQWKYYAPMMKDIWENYGIVVRVTLNMTDKIDCSRYPFWMHAVEFAGDTNVSQLSFRNVIAPETRVSTDESGNAARWIEEHGCADAYDSIVKDFKECTFDVIRKLSFGATVYDVNGVAVTMFDECVQHTNNNEDIRSLIYQEDGHMYTSWDSPASILF